eukprot:403339832
MTHGYDGLGRTKAYSLQIQPFYCYIEEYYVKECEKQNGHVNVESTCSKEIGERQLCYDKVKNYEKDIRLTCWHQFVDQYNCMKPILDNDEKTKNEQISQNTTDINSHDQNQNKSGTNNKNEKCIKINQNAFECIKGVVKQDE